MEPSTAYVKFTVIIFPLFSSPRKVKLFIYYSCYIWFLFCLIGTKKESKSGSNSKFPVIENLNN